MLEKVKGELAKTVADHIQKVYGIEHSPVVEVPPRRDLGDLAVTAPLHLARELKKNPRQIATELAESLPLPPGAREVRVEGAGYLNFFLDRSAFARRVLTEPLLSDPEAERPKVIVEHTNINPNKAAHIGHLRNAVLGDVVVRVLRAAGYPVEVQNYIDDTGVQLADVVVGFVELRGMSRDDIEAIPEPFDYACWDLYAEIGGWYEEDEARKEHRRATLHALEHNEGELAEIGRLIAKRIVHRHLETMARLGVHYDLLTHESSILELDFFAQAFELLKERGAIRLEEEGKNKGCWVMPLSESEEFAGLEDPDKVIVRSDSTVTYVGKDIAYQLWKFGLLGRDFGYRAWDEENVWQSVVDGQADHPEFGAAHRVINVIDARQSYLQKVVRAGLEALGHRDEAERSVHFAYEMVTLSRGTAEKLGYLDGEGSDGKQSLEMSGRRGIGVKADDLLDALEAKSRDEISNRNRDLDEAELDTLARQIATGALRFLMTKSTTTRVIAFDFDEALNFEGESGPYLQYSIVRAKNIRRRLADAGLPAEADPARVEGLAEELWSDDLWDLILSAAQIAGKVEAAGDTLEVSLVARHALDLAQQFNAAYHKHPILQEEDEALRTARLAATQVFVRGAEALTDLLGVPIPDRM